jgi:hypothetical protein
MHVSKEQSVMSNGGLDTHTIATAFLLAFAASGNGIIVVVCCHSGAIGVHFTRIATAAAVSLGGRSKPFF